MYETAIAAGNEQAISLIAKWAHSRMIARPQSLWE